MWIGETHWRRDQPDRNNTEPLRHRYSPTPRTGRRAVSGVSSGANIAASLRVAERLGPDATVVTILCDSGLRYLSIDLYRETYLGYAQTTAAADGHPLRLPRNVVHVASAAFEFSHRSPSSVSNAVSPMTNTLSPSDQMIQTILPKPGPK